MSGAQLAGMALVIAATGFAFACVITALNQKGKGGEK